MKYVKLTNRYLRDHGFQWEVGKKVCTSGNNKLCRPDWLRCYGAATQEQATLLAVLLDPVHFDSTAHRLWAVEVGGMEKNENGVRFGFTEMTLVSEIPVPEVSIAQRVRFGILCAMEVCSIPEWRRWAEKWLSGEDRTAMAAWGVMVDAAMLAKRARAAEVMAAEAAAEAATSMVRAANNEAAVRAAKKAVMAAATAHTLNLGLLAEKAISCGGKDFMGVAAVQSRRVNN